ncbi:MAG: hypothetical protein B6244_09810 [Candidatus Cloacimonetes bacterium 4572_55]|nr:MAG: hypothetical protein B6244_09810 [Candidatus Cloacimonetes bacterium 4572_55]
MNKLGLPDFKSTKEADVEIAITDQENGVHIEVRGRLDMESPALILGEYFRNMHRTILESNIGHVEVEFSDLKYMNSAAVSFLSSNWIRKVRGLNSYQLIFIYPKRYYLALSTMALLCQPNAIQKQIA